MALGVDPSVTFNDLPPELQQMADQARQRQALALALQKQFLQPNVPVNSGPVMSRMSALQPLAQALGSYVASKNVGSASQELADVGKQYQSAVDTERQTTEGVPVNERIAKLMASRYAPNRQYGEALSKETQREATEKHLNRQDAHLDAQEDLARGTLDMHRKAALANEDYKTKYLGHLDAQLQEARRNHNLEAQSRIQHLQIEAGRLGVAQQIADQKDPSLVAKPIPAPSVKLINDELEALGTARGIQTDLAAVKSKIDKGELQLGPMTNTISRVQNLLGQSTPNSQNFAEMKSTLEKLRNDSLRLNKGTQTEGDAVRAWNELFENMSDPKVVSNRLETIGKINERGANLRKMQVNSIRANYNHPEMDFSPYEAAASAPTILPGAEPTLEQIRAERARRGR